MRTLEEANRTSESFLPGLLHRLSEIPFDERESPSNKLIETFRTSGGAGLVVPGDHSGLGANPFEAAQVQRSIGALAPSLAVATTMHHFSVATLSALAQSPASTGLEWALLQGICDQNLLVASGFAEGRPGQGILAPAVEAQPTEGGFLVNGTKKPCSLTYSMDLLTASTKVCGSSDGPDQLGVVIIPSTADGITRHPFWASDILAGAESDELRLDNVFVEDDLLVKPDYDNPATFDSVQNTGFMWFTLLIGSSYLGMASAAVAKALAAERGSASARSAIGVRLETAALLLESIAHRLDRQEAGSGALAEAMAARYGAQDAILDAVRQTVELLGGVAFIGDRQVAYLAAACHCLSLHPPSRSATSETMSRYLSGTSDFAL